MITRDQLKALLNYDRNTGLFRRRVARGNQKAGSLAGALHRGYVEIKIGCRSYPASCLAWLYVTGYLPQWPREEVDHRNGVKNDNKFRNLRLVTHSINTQNQRRAHRRTSSGLLGVSRHRGVRGDVFHSRIRVAKRLLHLGTFPTAQQAHAAYLTAKRQLHPGNTL